LLRQLTAVSLTISLLLASCGGGGGGNGQPNPQFPDPVEEIAEADLTAAGLPDIGSLGTSAVRSASMLEIPEENQLVINLSLGWDSVIASHNLVEAADGDGWQVSAPEGETKRVLAWAVYEIVNGGGLHLWELEYEMSKSKPGLPVFYALANQTKGGWETGGPLRSTQGGGGIFNSGSALNFSQSQDYTMPNGSAYMAVLVGHPGDGNYNNSICTFGQCYCTGLLDSASENYPDEEYSMQWEADEFSLVLNGEVQTRGFNMGMPPALNARLLMGTDSGTQAALASQWTDHNDSDPGILFYDLSEANGSRHPYEMFVMADGSVRTINGFPLVNAGGTGTANGIIAILIGILGPIPNAPVNVYLDDIIIGTKTTDKRGRFEISGLEEGSYTIEVGEGSSQIVRQLEVQQADNILIGLLLPAVQ
jgi:hypothetical protein